MRVRDSRPALRATTSPLKNWRSNELCQQDRRNVNCCPHLPHRRRAPRTGLEAWRGKERYQFSTTIGSEQPFPTPCDARSTRFKQEKGAPSETTCTAHDVAGSRLCRHSLRQCPRFRIGHSPGRSQQDELHHPLENLGWGQV